MEMEKTGKYEINMIHGPILGKMLLFAFPLMLSGVLQLLFNAADIIVVGRFAGDASLAAVGATTSIINLLISVFIGISIGSNVLAAREYGAGKEKELSETVHTSMVLSFISGIFITVVGMVFAKYILILMKTPDDILGLATLYLRIYFLGMTATMLYNFGSSLLRALGDTRRPLFYLTIAGIINVILNLFFVIKLHMGVAGVGMATVISQCISAFLVLKCMTKETGGLKLYFDKLKINTAKLAMILRIGIPAGLEGVLFAISNVIIQASINTFGTVVVAGNSAASNIEGFIFFAQNAFFQASISFAGQNMGAGQFKRIKKITGVALICTIITGAALGALFVALGPQLLGIYTTKALVIQEGITRLKIVATSYAVCGAMDVFVGVLRGMGYSIMPTVVTLLGVCAFRVLWLATIFKIPVFHTIETVYLSYPVTWVITTVILIICYIWAFKQLEKNQIREEQ